MYKVEIPRILFLALDIARFYRNTFFNTNDLASLSNRYKGDLVRQKANKQDYKYLEDTRFGGLRGNFSTLLTWRGLVKRGSSIVSAYSLGRDTRLVNAVCQGKVRLNPEDLAAYTNDEGLMKILTNESWLRNVREGQAHVKSMLKKNPELPLVRDSVYFPKDSVFKSSNGQYFIRSLVNNFVDSKGEVLQFSIINLWEGKKFNLRNLHPLIVIPTRNDPWGGGIYAIKNEDLYVQKPFLLNVNLKTKKCVDQHGMSHKLYSLSEALIEFSNGNENIQNMLDYKWDVLRKLYCEKEVDYEIRKDDEFSRFLNIFLDWKRNFFVDGKEVVDMRSISSGGPDIELVFSGGTFQRVELEHQWGSYVDHGHHLNNAFRKVWIFAEEPWESKKILKIFSDLKAIHGERIPDVFLCLEKGERKAYRADWENQTFTPILLKFL